MEKNGRLTDRRIFFRSASLMRYMHPRHFPTWERVSASSSEERAIPVFNRNKLSNLTRSVSRDSRVVCSLKGLFKESRLA